MLHNTILLTDLCDVSNLPVRVESVAFRAPVRSIALVVDGELHIVVNQNLTTQEKADTIAYIMGRLDGGIDDG